MTNRAWLFAVALTACRITPSPSPPDGPTPPDPAPAPDAAPPSPAPVEDGCSASCATLQRLGCSEWSPTCPERCRRADEALASLHSTPSNHACSATSQSCAAARACP